MSRRNYTVFCPERGQICLFSDDYGFFWLDYEFFGYKAFGCSFVVSGCALHYNGGFSHVFWPFG